MSTKSAIKSKCQQNDSIKIQILNEARLTEMIKLQVEFMTKKGKAEMTE